MIKTDLSDAIGSISDRYLLEALEGLADGGVVETVTDGPGEVGEMKAKKGFTFRKAAGIAIAACLVFAMGITAYAADFSFTDWFKGVFSGPSSSEEVYELLSADDLAACTSNGTTITPVAAIADNAMCYIRLKIEAPEGTELRIPDGDTEGFLQLSDEAGSADLLVNKKTGESEPGESSLYWEDAVPGDNAIEAVLIYAGQTGHTRFNDHEARTVNIHNICLQDIYKNYSVILAGDWSFDVVFPVGETKVLDVRDLEVQPLIDGETSDAAGTEIILTQMSISPLSLEVAYKFTTPDADMIPGPGTIRVVMKDGTEITSEQGGGEDGTGWTHFTRIFNTPIDVSQVDYVQFGSQQIKVN